MSRLKASLAYLSYPGQANISYIGLARRRVTLFRWWGHRPSWANFSPYRHFWLAQPGLGKTIRAWASATVGSSLGQRGKHSLTCTCKLTRLGGWPSFPWHFFSTLTGPNPPPPPHVCVTWGEGQLNTEGFSRAQKFQYTFFSSRIKGLNNCNCRLFAWAKG